VKKRVMVFALVLLFGSNVFATSRAFTNAINTDWATAGNWTGGVVPFSGDDVVIRAAAVISASNAAKANILRVAWSAYGSIEVGSIVVNGTLTTYWDTRIAEGIGVNGTITVNAGATFDNRSSSSSGEFAIGMGGTGTLNVYGTVYTDSMDITNWSLPGTSTGTVNVFPGGVVVDAGRLTVGGAESWGGNGSLVIYPGGSFSCGDNWSNKLQSWIDRGAIRAAAGCRLVVTAHTADVGKTFTAVELPKKALSPNPTAGNTINSITPTLSWTAGSDAVSHEIYFGTNLSAVANAARRTGDINGDDQVNFKDILIMAGQWLTTPAVSGGSADITGVPKVDLADFVVMAIDWGKTGDGLFKGYLQNATYQPGTLVNNTTYYWRVDEMDSLGVVHKGDVWAFAYDSRDAVELLVDPDFQRGFNVGDPTPGAWVVQGTMQWDSTNGNPVWSLGQWNTSYSIVNAVPVQLPSGSVEFANATKRVVMGPINSSDADLIFMVDTRLETTVPGVSWPHLLTEQDLSSRTYFLSQLSGLDFHVEAILNSANLYDPGAVGQFLVYIIIQNRNTASSGYGKFYWFGIALYDNRYPNQYLSTTMYYQYDAGSGMMLCQMPQAGFASGKIHDGNWVVFDGNILPRVIEAFNYFKSTGGIPANSNMSDFCISGINMGWEVPIAHYRGEIQVRNLGLKAVLP